MPFDIVAFYESQTATALSKVAAVEDDIYKVSVDDIICLSKAPLLAGFFHIGVSTPKYAELRQPSLKVPYRFYKSSLAAAVNGIHAFTDLSSTPLPLFAGEKLNAYVQNATAEVSLIGLLLASGPGTLAQIQATRPTHAITGYSDTTLTAGGWHDVPITWDQDLPQGRYAIVGMKVASYIAAGFTLGLARLVGLDFPGWRPGVPISEMGGDKTIVDNFLSADIFPYRWPMMREISFKHDTPPDLEILSGAALTDHIVELLLQKVA